MHKRFWHDESAIENGSDFPFTDSVFDFPFADSISFCGIVSSAWYREKGSISHLRIPCSMFPFTDSTSFYCIVSSSHYSPLSSPLPSYPLLFSSIIFLPSPILFPSALRSSLASRFSSYRPTSSRPISLGSNGIGSGRVGQSIAGYNKRLQER